MARGGRSGRRSGWGSSRRSSGSNNLVHNAAFAEGIRSVDHAIETALKQNRRLCRAPAHVFEDFECSALTNMGVIIMVVIRFAHGWPNVALMRHLKHLPSFLLRPQQMPRREPS